MSLEAMAWAWGQKLPSSQKLTLLAIADIANEQNDHKYWGGVTALADKQMISRRQMSDNLNALIEAGYLRIIKRGAGRKTTYQLIMSDENDSSHQSAKSDVRKPSHQSGSDVRNPSHPEAQDSSHPIETQERTQSLVTQRASRNEHWDAIVQTFGPPADDQTSLYGKLAQRVRNADPSEVADRARDLAIVHPVVTVASLYKNWSWIRSPAGMAAIHKARLSTSQFKEALKESPEQRAERLFGK